MSTEQNKAMVRRIFEEVFNKGNLSVVDEIMTNDYVYHMGQGMEFKGPDGFKQLATIFRNAFPDLHFTVEDMVAEGDKVATRATLQGTHKGDLMGIAPTGKQFTTTGFNIIRFAGGKEVEAFGAADMLAMYQQLGVAPPIGPGGK